MGNSLLPTINQLQIGLYKRQVVTVSTILVTPDGEEREGRDELAYIYFQGEAKFAAQAGSVRSFPRGDWLEGKKNKQPTPYTVGMMLVCLSACLINIGVSITMFLEIRNMHHFVLFPKYTEFTVAFCSSIPHFYYDLFTHKHMCECYE